jgi:hypothetical protein
VTTPVIARPGERDEVSAGRGEGITPAGLALPRVAATLIRWWPYAILFGATVLVGAELARPLRSASIGFDSAATVLYFQRIVGGQPLEAFVTTTPKPLLTVLFGVLQSITHDWRTLAWLTLLAQGLGVTLSAYLAARVAGPVAAAFVGVALLDASSLLFDVGFAMATPFALVSWAAAGLALTAARPRFALAGVALALATLARVETLIVVGAALLAVAWASYAPRRWRVASVPVRAWLVPALGLAAIPVMLVHDQLLAGDPLYWTKAAAVYGAAVSATLPSALDVLETMVAHFWAMGGVVLLALLGTVRLAWERRYGLLVGVIALGPGVAAFLVSLAARHILVPTRYFAAIDVAVIFAAGLGAAWLAIAVTNDRTLPAPLHRYRPIAASLLPVGIAAVAALVLSGLYWQQDPRLRAVVDDNRRLALDTQRVEPYLASAAPAGLAAGAKPSILVPVPVQPRVAVDLRRSLLEIGPSTASRIDIAGGKPSAGQVLFHDRASDGTDPRWSDFETTTTRRVGPITLVPVYTDAPHGIWVIALQ